MGLLLPQTFDALSSFDLMMRISDFFRAVEPSVSIGTKQVMMDFYRNGTGLAFGKVAEAEGAMEFGWPLILAAPLALSMGGTGADSPMAALVSLGAAAANHSHLPNELTGSLSIAKGGTGAASAKAALSNLGIFYADTLPASGVDGQICLVPV